MHTRKAPWMLTMVCVAGLGIMLVAGGCDKAGPGTDKDSPKGGDAGATVDFAVCDLDKVAEELGFRQQMDQLLAQRKAALQTQMNELQSKLQAGLKEKVDEFGKEPTDEQKQQLGQMQAQAIQRVRQAEAQANNILARARAGLISQIRTKLKVPIDKVATDRGIRVVASQRPDFVLFVAGVADITPDVISAARAAEFEALSVEETPATEDEVKATDGILPDDDS